MNRPFVLLARLPRANRHTLPSREGGGWSAAKDVHHRDDSKASKHEQTGLMGSWWSQPIPYTPFDTYKNTPDAIRSKPHEKPYRPRIPRGTLPKTVFGRAKL